MRLTFFIIFLLFVGTATNADPEWLSPNMKKSDCDGVFWKTAGMCYQEFNRQHIVRLNDYLRNEINNINSESCDKNELLKYFEEREILWNNYSSVQCAILSHCVGYCGSGHSSAVTGCMSSMSGEWLTKLENEVKNGISIWGCPIKSSKQTKKLVTTNYEILLFGKCELGLLACDDVSYKGINKKSKKEISLNGKTLMKYDKNTDIDMPAGYVFVNGDIEYQVLNSGLLKVIDTKKGKTILQEQGQWK